MLKQEKFTDKYLDTLREAVCDIAVEAGVKILNIYRNMPENQWNVMNKQDDTPVTVADKVSHEHIVKALKTLSPNIPIISEESALTDYSVRKEWPVCWLVDPLDGTKEFLAKNGEFTVNIALIYHGRSILGAIYAPTSQELFSAHQYSDFHVYNQEHVFPDASPSVVRLLVSRHHTDARVERYRKWLEAEFGVVHAEAVGSSLKFCRIAQGYAHAYLRLGPTSEWDTAAGQIILARAGGGIRTLGGAPLTYNKRDTLLNKGFLAVADERFIWGDMPF